MIFFGRDKKTDEIKKDLLQMLLENIDLEAKGVSDINKLNKSQLDSIELMTLLQLIEKKWGRIELAELYLAKDLDTVAKIIAQKVK
jgi:aryl carrier-like protein